MEPTLTAVGFAWQGDGEVKRREEQRRKQQAPTSTLFVVNFDVTRTRENDLAHEFNKYGRTKRVQIKKNFAFIQVRHGSTATLFDRV
jgi:arginine/serine-rich splicing factor 4/5/6